MTSTRRARIALAALVVPALAVSLTGCFSGSKATTNMQATMVSGNGAAGQAGNMKVNNATIVLGPEGSKTATLIFTVANIGVDVDSVVGATVAGKPATLIPADAAIPVEPSKAVNFGYVGSTNSANVADFEVGVSNYVPVTITFANSGVLKLSALTVEARGIYEGIVPGATN